MGDLHQGVGAVGDDLLYRPAGHLALHHVLHQLDALEAHHVGEPVAHDEVHDGAVDEKDGGPQCQPDDKLFGQLD